ncbi:hypothetical protein ZHAS_00012542 [Anopheles sinensis]|uniref:Uncharacterized protein n=1 Tax=Anopheles sinensis TaxID=74873 RepID=A0A084W360_ANOSI|nr:hypothetical protein ZHAS_00012542 [Anopheles sinensis]
MENLPDRKPTAAQPGKPLLIERPTNLARSDNDGYDHDDDDDGEDVDDGWFDRVFHFGGNGRVSGTSLRTRNHQPAGH